MSMYTHWQNTSKSVVFSALVLITNHRYRYFSRLPPPLRFLAKSSISAHAHWVMVNAHNSERAMSLRNGMHLPTTQCACAEFEDFLSNAKAGAVVKKIYSTITSVYTADRLQLTPCQRGQLIYGQHVIWSCGPETAMRLNKCRKDKKRNTIYI
jgi:hypothetical protein